MQTFTIDDEDPAIVYSGHGWSVGETIEPSNRTSHSTTIPGSNFSFTFQGTSISVYGTLGPNRTPQAAIVSTYFIDNTSSVFTGIQNSAAQLQIRFYSSPVLPDGTHTLVATFDSAPVGHTYILDYLICTSSSSDSLPSPAQSQSEVPPSSTPSSGADVKTLVPAIVVPICVVLLLTLAGFYSLLRKRSRRSEKSIPDTDNFYSHPAHIAPYHTSSVLSSSPLVRPRRVSSNGGSEDDLRGASMPDADNRTRATVATTFTDEEGGRDPDTPSLRAMQPASKPRTRVARDRPNETGPSSVASSADAPPSYASNL